MVENEQPVALTVRQFLNWANISHTTFYKELKAGRIKAVKAGRRTLVLRSEAEAWINSLPEAV